MLTHPRLLLKVSVWAWLALTTTHASADTIEHYINIANAIPQMELKADAESQVWARSARNVLNITSETVAETLTTSNQEATKLGRPLFCLPKGSKLDLTTMNQLLLDTYRELNNPDKNQWTVSQVAWYAVNKRYPCSGSQNNMTKVHEITSPAQVAMQHAAAK